MKKLSSSNYEIVRQLFAEDYPNLPFVHGLIEGVLPGEIFVDNTSNPASCILVSAASYVFTSGISTSQEMRSCLDLLKDKAEIKLVLPELGPHEAKTLGLVPTARRQYSYSNARPIELKNTSGYEIRSIASESFFKECIWFDLMDTIFGGAENFLQRGFGCVFWDADSGIIASEAYGIPSKQYVEIGTVTHPAYRGKGLSTMLCNHLIRHISELGLRPIWSCDESNAASWSVAERQGMDGKLNYNFYNRTMD
ncbi:hypothetical protein C4K04_0019 [Pseudomonas chlororaphis]|uniref:N-acetyltransferase domain-containing protein n=1 Tax=Pseudomonas chlororaphis TaxID=587753 RepID=A0A3G7TF77_9PSED|nr:GNAT family N-acetyltransferase [Pseudomonas chlororaphis]AZE45730.1 hypothetical protein C4K04_0019 [Pseudomonas chlororaphis]